MSFSLIRLFAGDRDDALLRLVTLLVLRDDSDLTIYPIKRVRPPTSVAIVARVPDHPRSNQVELDAAAAGEEIGLTVADPIHGDAALGRERKRRPRRQPDIT